MTPYLLIQNIHIQNANAMSSPVTIGFPAMTAWLGGVHALERRLRAREGLSDISFTEAAVSCHAFDLQTYRGKGAYEDSILLPAKPLTSKSKQKNPLSNTKTGGAPASPNDVKTPSFIEEARIHLNVSLLLRLGHIMADIRTHLIEAVREELPCLKLAGGDILRFRLPESIFYVDETAEDGELKVLSKLMPGYVLVERRDLMEKAMADRKNGVEALLHYLEIQYQPEKKKDDEVLRWVGKKAEPGWIVPIAVGFKGLSPLGKVACQRDAETPHRFAESVITLGEFKMPYHFQHISEILWKYEYLADKNLYLCRNK